MGSYSLLVGLSTVVSLLCQIAVTAVVLLVVRPLRPDAARTLVVWALGSLATSVLLLVSGFLVRMLATQLRTADAMLSLGAIEMALRIPIAIGLSALLAHGLVQLAKSQAT